MNRKILHLITSLEGGGTENFLYQILTHSPNGFDHQVLYLKKNGVIGERLRRHEVSVRPAGSLPALYKTLRQEKPAILHTCLYSAHIIGRCLGRLARVPAIITSQRSIDIWQKPWQTVVDQWTLPFSNAVIVNSQAAQHIIEKRRGNGDRPEIFQIPNGVDASRFKSIDRSTARQRYGLPSDALVGGTLMRLHSEKGSDLIPDFAARLLPVFPKLHFLIGGVGPLERSIKDQIAASTYADRIHFIGWEDETPTFLAASDFFWSLSREESFPQTLVEASATGLPWVAPETGGVSELLAAGAAGKTYPRLDIPAAAEQTTLLLNDLPRRSDEARRAAPALREHFSLERMIRQVYDVFNTVSGTPRGSA